MFSQIHNKIYMHAKLVRPDTLEPAERYLQILYMKKNHFFVNDNVFAVYRHKNVAL